MFKVKVFTIGKCKETWLQEALAEYEKRLQGRLTLEWKLVKDTALLEECADQEKGLIALDPKGTLLTSEAWSARFVKQASHSFFIGGPEGLPNSILRQASLCWSLSPLTFTHQLTRLILVEQLYRALEIDRGSQYHK